MGTFRAPKEGGARIADSINEILDMPTLIMDIQKKAREAQRNLVMGSMLQMLEQFSSIAGVQKKEESCWQRHGASSDELTPRFSVGRNSHAAP